MTVLYDKPILTMAQVREWQARSAEIAVAMRAMNEEMAGLARKLEAAKILIGELPEMEIAVSTELPPAERGETEPDQTHAESLSDAALDAVAALGNVPRPDAIKKWIVESRPAHRERLASSPNYFYTVLIRHVQKGRLIREGNGYRLPTSSPQGEAGAVAAPAHN